MHQAPYGLIIPTRGGQLEAGGAVIGDGWQILSDICTRFPLRTVGSPGEREHAVYISDRLRETGLRPVRIDPVPCLGFDIGDCELRLGDAHGQVIECQPVAFSGSTPPQGMSAPLIYADDVDFVDFDAPDLKGRVLLVFGWFGDFSTAEYYRKAAGAGLAGVIVIRDNDRAVAYGLPPAAAAQGHVPVVSVSHPTGTTLLRSGVKTVFLRLRQRLQETTGSNVIAILSANRERLDERVLMVSTHLDAAPVRPAAADNAVGAAMMVEVARCLARAERGRDIWFVGYTDEEWGFSGSLQFARDYADIAANCLCQFYYDGHGTAAGVNRLGVTGPPELAGFMQRVAADIEHPMKVELITGNLDPVALYATGVPSVQVARHPQRTWHTAYDVPDDLAPAVLRAGIHLYAEALYRLANAPVPPFDRAVAQAARDAAMRRITQWTPKTVAEAERWRETMA